jgi:predicted RNase H-like nuclease
MVAGGPTVRRAARRSARRAVVRAGEAGAMVRLVGVDGCRAGWVVAASDEALVDPSFSIARSVRELLDALAGISALVVVDIPIGLPSGGPRDAGIRRVDGLARAFVGGRRGTSVFSAPCRPTLTAATFRDACDAEIAARGRGKGLSQQAYRIMPKIREVDEAIDPSHHEPVTDGPRVRVREAHPEVTFAALAGVGQPGYGLVHSKRGCARCRGAECPGEADRLALLRRHVTGFDPYAVRERLLREHPRAPGRTGAVVGRDDIIDAVACLVTAQRIVNGRALTFPPDEPDLDERGLRMEILA